MSYKHVDTAIITTLLFFEIFTRALEEHELINYLYTKEKIEKPLLQSRLKALLESGQINYSGQYYYCNNEDSVAQALHSKALRQQYAPKIKKAAHILSCIPFVKAAYMCNSYAIAGFKESSDLDLFIVTHKRYIWLTRLISFFVFHILKIRRFDHDIAGLFCLTFYATEDSLNLESIALKPEDPYLTYWTTTLIPLWETEFDQQIKEQNTWAHAMQPNAATPTPFIKKSFISEVLQSFCEQVLAYTGLATIYNNKARKTFKERFQKRKKVLPAEHGIIITDTIQKLHDTDYRPQYRKQLLEKMMQKQF